MRLRGGARARTTLSDVARVAGVSPITVSRALREPHKVSEKLREKILAVVEDVGYVPNFAARALASRHNGVVAVLGPVLELPGFALAVKGIEERFRESDVRTQLANVGLDAAEEAGQIGLFVAQNPAGIILESVAEFPVNRPLIDDVDCPVVQLMDTSLEPLDMGVGIRNRDAAAVAVEHLLSKGYRTIALLGGSKDIRSRRRFEGYRDVLSQAGLYDPALVFDSHGAHSLADGASLMRLLRKKRPDADAVFCHNDELALGALFSAHQLGLNVPDEFGICGYNGADFIDMENPPITTIQVPLFDIGYRAADLIMKSMKGAPRVEGAVEFSFELVEGVSTRR